MNKRKTKFRGVVTIRFADHTATITRTITGMASSVLGVTRVQHMLRDLCRSLRCYPVMKVYR